MWQRLRNTLSNIKLMVTGKGVVDMSEIVLVVGEHDFKKRITELMNQSDRISNGHSVRIALNGIAHLFGLDSYVIQDEFMCDFFIRDWDLK